MNNNTSHREAISRWDSAASNDNDDDRFSLDATNITNELPYSKVNASLPTRDTNQCGDTIYEQDQYQSLMAITSSNGGSLNTTQNIFKNKLEPSTFESYFQNNSKDNSSVASKNRTNKLTPAVSSWNTS